MTAPLQSGVPELLDARGFGLSLRPMARDNSHLHGRLLLALGLVAFLAAACSSAGAARSHRDSPASTAPPTTSEAAPTTTAATAPATTLPPPTTTAAPTTFDVGVITVTWV